MLHAKTANIDGGWSTVGCSNLDWWSIARNDEINTVVLSEGFGRRMQEMFMSDLENARKIDLERWQRRSFLKRIEEAIVRPMKPMM